jgi:hypothetical protein
MVSNLSVTLVTWIWAEILSSNQVKHKRLTDGSMTSPGN